MKPEETPERQKRRAKAVRYCLYPLEESKNFFGGVGAS